MFTSLKNKLHYLISPKGLLSLAAVLSLELYPASAVKAQTCLTDSLIINTGYTPTGLIGTGVNDPHWRITSVSPDLSAILTIPSLPYPAVKPPICCGWVVSDPNSTWISLYNPSSSSTWYTTPNTAKDYSFITEREFTLCSDDSVQINISTACDNWIRSIKIDTTTVYTSSSPSGASSVYLSFTPYSSFGVALSSGTHTIQFDVVNFAIFEAPEAANPHGLQVRGTVVSATGSNSIVNDHECPEYVCENTGTCSDECYWKLDGNNIAGSKNIFGTLTNDPVRIKTNNLFRGVFDAKGQVGWNTMSPTAYLHVLCTGNNSDQGMGMSDVRFERLEPGNGTVLVIDQNGYVYNSRITLNQNGAVSAETQQQYEAKNAATELRITELEKQVRELTIALKSGNQQNADILEQNVPNPSGKETSVGYYIRNIRNSASLIVYDMNGREIMHLPVVQAGKGQVAINCMDMLPGTYLYTLVVDGSAVDTKQMVISK